MMKQGASMALPFQREEDPTGTLSFAAGSLSDKVPGAAGGALLAEMEGVWDRGTREWADHALKAAMADPDILYLVLDARGIEWMSDGSFGVFGAAFKAMHKRGGALVLIPSPAMREQLELFGFFGFIFIASDPANAAALIEAIVSGEDVAGECRQQLRFEARLSPWACMVARYRGDMDKYAADWLTVQIARYIEVGFIRLAMDLSGCRSVSASGIGGLAGVFKLVNQLHGRLILFGLDPMIHEVFESLGFVQFFEIVKTEDEALAALWRKADELRFPLIIKCPTCSVRTRVAKPMLGRCRRCHTTLRIAPDGTVSLG
jgi:anti-anti-sigma factor